jgi:hypothetical protein
MIMPVRNAALPILIDRVPSEAEDVAEPADHAARRDSEGLE